MKIFLPLIAGVILLCNAGIGCAAEDKMYVGIVGGAVLERNHNASNSSISTTIKSYPGFGVGAVTGYIFGTVRTDFEFMLRRTGLRQYELGDSSIRFGGNTMLLTYMANLTKEIQLEDSPVIPFVTVGMGMATCFFYQKAPKGYDSKSFVASEFSYQLGAGATYQTSEKTFLDLTYKYLGTTSFKFGDTLYDYGSHNVMIGVRYLF